LKLVAFPQVQNNLHSSLMKYSLRGAYLLSLDFKAWFIEQQGRHIVSIALLQNLLKLCHLLHFALFSQQTLYPSYQVRLFLKLTPFLDHHLLIKTLIYYLILYLPPTLHAFHHSNHFHLPRLHPLHIKNHLLSHLLSPLRLHTLQFNRIHPPFHLTSVSMHVELVSWCPSLPSQCHRSLHNNLNHSY